MCVMTGGVRVAAPRPLRGCSRGASERVCACREWVSDSRNLETKGWGAIIIGNLLLLPWAGRP